MKMTPSTATAAMRTRATGLMAIVALTLGACASPQHKAPVEDRGSRAGTAVASPAATAAAAEAAKPTPVADNAGKPGFYSVKPGDTLIRIGLETGQNWRDIARWNNVDNPNVLEVGQVLRVTPPGADAAATVARPVPVTKVEARPLDASGRPVVAAAAASGTAVASAAPLTSAAPAPAASATSTASAASAASAAARENIDDDLIWAWPTASAVTTPFDEVRSKGLVFAGKAGDPVMAAADGRVVYAGSGLRGYGNLVIVKHNNTYLTAYAHNQLLLVKEDQVVRRGQKIAEMGSSDADRVQLHFELRKLGKPIDPARLLPPR
jgi:lipoprotein NlpD